MEKVKLSDGREVKIPKELKTVGEILEYFDKTYGVLPDEGVLGAIASTWKTLKELEKQKDVRKAREMIEVTKARLKAIKEAYGRLQKYPVCEECIKGLEKSLRRRKFSEFEFYWTKSGEGYGRIGSSTCECEISLWHPDSRKPVQDLVFGMWNGKFYIKKSRGL